MALGVLRFVMCRLQDGDPLRVSAGLETDAVQIKSIDVSPDPPQPGEDLTVTVKATAEDKIEVRVSPQHFFFFLQRSLLGGCLCRCHRQARSYQDPAERV